MKLVVLLAIALVVSACQAPRGVSSAARTVALPGDVSLTVVDEGAGTPVIFLHGAVADHRMWEFQRAVVANKHRFIAVTMRYFGTAPWPDSGANFSQATHVADIAAFIRNLNTGPVYLVGHSYGARTALILAFRHPELVRGLFLNEPGLLSAVADSAARDGAARDESQRGAVAALAQAGDYLAVARRWSDFVNGVPGSYEQLPAAMRQMMLDNARTVALQLGRPTMIPLTCSEIGQIRAPSVITIGQLTRPYSRITVEAVSRCMRSSQLIEIKGAQHRASAQNPAAFNSALLSFLAQH